MLGVVVGFSRLPFQPQTSSFEGSPLTLTPPRLPQPQGQTNVRRLTGFPDHQKSPGFFASSNSATSFPGTSLKSHPRRWVSKPQPAVASRGGRGESKRKNDQCTEAHWSRVPRPSGYLGTGLVGYATAALGISGATGRAKEFYFDARAESIAGSEFRVARD